MKSQSLMIQKSSDSCLGRLGGTYSRNKSYLMFYKLTKNIGVSPIKYKNNSGSRGTMLPSQSEQCFVLRSMVSMEALDSTESVKFEEYAEQRHLHTTINYQVM